VPGPLKQQREEAGNAMNNHGYAFIATMTAIKDQLLAALDQQPSDDYETHYRIEPESHAFILAQKHRDGTKSWVAVHPETVRQMHQSLRHFETQDAMRDAMRDAIQEQSA